MFNIKKHHGFTLSELLVSLTVIGLISAFSVPKVFSAMRITSVEAKMKSQISAVQDMVMNGHMQGEWSLNRYRVRSMNDELVKSVHSHINSAVQCDAKQRSNGCDHDWGRRNGKGSFLLNDAGRWVMHDGSKLTVYKTSNKNFLTFLIDVEDSNVNTQNGKGSDQIALSCNISDNSLQFNNGMHPARPGECQPYDKHHAPTYTELFS